jgi:hypothetical protein
MAGESIGKVLSERLALTLKVLTFKSAASSHGAPAQTASKCFSTTALRLMAAMPNTFDRRENASSMSAPSESGSTVTVDWARVTPKAPRPSSRRLIFLTSVCSKEPRLAPLSTSSPYLSRMFSFMLSLLCRCRTP